MAQHISMQNFWTGILQQSMLMDSTLFQGADVGGLSPFTLGGGALSGSAMRIPGDGAKVPILDQFVGFNPAQIAPSPFQCASTNHPERISPFFRSPQPIEQDDGIEVPWFLLAGRNAPHNSPLQSAHIYIDQAHSIIPDSDPVRPDDDVVRAMPGLTMSLGQWQTLRQELRLELQLSLRLEQRLVLTQRLTQEWYGDDVLGESAPDEFFMTLDIILQMVKSASFGEYAQSMRRAFQSLDDIGPHNYRLRAACRLCEELYRHPTLRRAVLGIYRDELNRAFGYTPAYPERFSLNLIVAASMSRAKVDPKDVSQMAGRAFSIARAAEDDFEWQAVDRTNFRHVSDYLAGSGEAEAVISWIDELLGPRRKPAAETDEPPDDDADMQDTEAATSSSPSNDEMAQLMEDFIIIAFMKVQAQAMSNDEETFDKLLRLAQNCSWEEVAAKAYFLLSHNGQWRQRLETALGHFTSNYYRAKAAFALAIAKHRTGQLQTRTLIAAAETLLDRLDSDGPREAVLRSYERRAVFDLLNANAETRHLLEERSDWGRIPASVEHADALLDGAGLADALSLSHDEILERASGAVDALRTTMSSSERREQAEPAAEAAVTEEQAEPIAEAPAEGQPRPADEPAPAEEPDPASEAASAPKKAERTSPLGEYYPNIGDDADLHREISDLLYGNAGAAAFSGIKPADAASVTALLKNIYAQGGHTAIIDAIRSIPDSPVIGKDEGLRRANVLIAGLKGVLSQDSCTYHLACIFVAVKTEYDGQGPKMRTIARHLNGYLEAAEHEEGIPNLTMIADMTEMYRIFFGIKGIQTPTSKLMVHVGERIRLMREKIEEIRDELRQPDGAEDEADLTEKLNRWEDHAADAEAHLLASRINLQGWSPEYEEKMTRKIKELGSSELIAVAAFTRALHIFGVFRSIRSVEELTEGYVTLGLEAVEDISHLGRRAHVVRGLLEKFDPKFIEAHNLKERLLKAMDDRYITLDEAIGDASAARGEADASWFELDNIAGALSDETIAPDAVVRIFDNKAINRLVQRGKVTPETAATLYSAQIENGFANPFAATWLIQELDRLEKGDAAIPAKHHDLIEAFVEMGNHKIVDYAMNRCRQALKRLADGLGDRDRMWISFVAASEKFPVDVVERFIFEKEALGPDHLYLFVLLIANGRFGRAVIRAYNRYKENENIGRFLMLFRIVRKNMPGIDITLELLELIEGEIKSRGVDAARGVVEDWGARYQRFEKMGFRDRIQALHRDPILRMIYYHQNIGRTLFRNGPVYTYDQFGRNIEYLATAEVRYDHDALQRFEKVLSRWEPLDSDRRRQAEAGLDAAPYLSDADREFVRRLIKTNEPMTEDDLNKLTRIWRDVYPGVIDILLPNRQRAFYLYNGLTPIPHDAPGRTPEGGFEIVFEPGAGGTLDLMTQLSRVQARFSDQFDELASLAKAAYALRRVNEKIAVLRHPMLQATARKTLEESLSNARSPKQILDRASEFYSRLATLDNRAMQISVLYELRSDIEKHMTESVLPELTREKSIFLEASSHMDREALRHHTRGMRFDDISPQLSALTGAKIVWTTDRRKEIAGRLGFTEVNADNRMAIEAELLLDIAGVDGALRAAHLPHIVSQMSQAIDEERNIGSFLGMASQGGRRLRVRHVPRADILTFLQIGNFRPCCISTDGSQFENVLHFFGDLMTQPLVVSDADTNEALGHMIGHFGLKGFDNSTAYLLNGMYMRVPHRSTAIDQGNLSALELFARGAGLEYIYHGIHSYHDLSESPPKGYSRDIIDVIRLQSIADKDGKAIPMYNDLGIDPKRPNAIQRPALFWRQIKD